MFESVRNVSKRKHELEIAKKVTTGNYNRYNVQLIAKAKEINNASLCDAEKELTEEERETFKKFCDEFFKKIFSLSPEELKKLANYYDKPFENTDGSIIVMETLCQRMQEHGLELLKQGKAEEDVK